MCSGYYKKVDANSGEIAEKKESIWIFISLSKNDQKKWLKA